MMKKMPCTRLTTAPAASADQAGAGRWPGSARPVGSPRLVGEMGEHVGAEAEQGAVAERDHARVAGDQVEAHGQDGEDRDLGDDLQAEEIGARPVEQQGAEDDRGEPVAHRASDRGSSVTRASGGKQALGLEQQDQQQEGIHDDPGEVGHQTRPKVRVAATRSEPTRAPVSEPSPPTTTTIRVWIRIATPIPARPKRPAGRPPRPGRRGRSRPGRPRRRFRRR